MVQQDIRLALRSLRKSPGFVLATVLSLGVGVGFTATVAGVIDAVMHPYVPYDAPDQLFRIVQRGDGATHSIRGYEKFIALRDGARAFDGVAALSPGGDTLRVGGSYQAGGIEYVTANYFDVVGVVPRIGRAFSEGSLTSTDDQSAVISYSLWRRAFAGRRSLSTVAISVGNSAYAVVGVMPPGVTIAGWEPSAWLLLSPSRLTWPYVLEPIVRLRRGRSLVDAKAELALVASRLAAMYGTGYQPFGFEIRPARADALHIQDVHWAMAGAAAAVLLIACANLASLMLARGLNRRRELAVRMALGASRIAAIRPMLVECLIVALAGGTVGSLLSVWGVDAFTYRNVPGVAALGVLRPQLSWRVFALAIAATGFSVVIFGLIPALRASSQQPAASLKEGAAATTGRPLRSYGGLVVIQIALCMVLLLSTGLLAQAAFRIASFDFGYDAAHLWAVFAQASSRAGDTSVASVVARYDQARTDMTAVAASLPGVLAVAAISEARTDGGAIRSEETGTRGSQLSQLRYYIVTPSFLQTLGIPVLSGRDFQPGDVGGPGVVIVDRAVASRLWPNGSAVGHLIKLGDARSKESWLPVVGIAQNATLAFEEDPDIPPEKGIYVVRPPNEILQIQLVVRLVSDDARLLQRLRLAMSTSARGGHASVVPWLGSYRSIVSGRRFVVGLFGVLGLFGLGLSAGGVYGVLSYSVSQRKREFAVRIALGATPFRVLALIMRDGLLLTLAGTGVGALVGIWTTKMLGALLFTVNALDAPSLISAELVLFCASLAACMVPAAAAARADPLEILRAA